MNDEKTTIEIEALKDLHATIERQAAEIERLRAGVMSKEVRGLIVDAIDVARYCEDDCLDSSCPGCQKYGTVRSWLESQPTATDKARCSKCGWDHNDDELSRLEHVCHQVVKRTYAVCPLCGESQSPTTTTVCHCSACGETFHIQTIVISPPREVEPQKDLK